MTDGGIAHCYRHPNREAGVRCTNLTSTHGFTLTASAYTLY